MPAVGRFSGKVVLVTGAASGLGRALAIAFAREGADLLTVDVDVDGLEGTAAKVRKAGSHCLAWRVDVSNRAEMESLAEQVLSELGRLDVLVNNAGVGVGGELRNIPMDDIEWIMGINLMGEVYGTRLFLPHMIERGEGHIVNVSSLSGLVVLPFHIPYTTTKFGITGFSEALWAEARAHGIGVTLVCPGAIKTRIMENTRLAARSEGQQQMGASWIRLLEKGGMEPDDAAEKILRAVERKRFLLLLGSEAYLLYYLRRLFPNLMRRTVALLTARVSRDERAGDGRHGKKGGSTMRRCGECGFPLMFARIADWRGDGTIIATDRRGVTSQITCLESEELESLFDGLSEAIGMPVDRFLVQAQKSIGKVIYSITPLRRLLRLPQNRFFRPQWLMRLLIRLASREVAALGFGVMSLDGYRPGESLVLRFANPCLVPRTVGSAMGFYESIEDMPSASAEYGMEGGELVVRIRHADEAPPAASRLYFEDVKPGTGPLGFERCGTCSVPRAVSRELRWDVGRGAITNRDSGRREVIIAVQSINAIQRELASELGEGIHETLYHVQKELASERLRDVEVEDPAAFYERYLEYLALRGLGYPTRFERDDGSIDVEVGSAYNQTLYAARIAAALEKVEGAPSKIEWETRDSDKAVYRITTGGGV